MEFTVLKVVQLVECFLEEKGCACCPKQCQGDSMDMIGHLAPASAIQLGKSSFLGQQFTTCPVNALVHFGSGCNLKDNLPKRR